MDLEQMFNIQKKFTVNMENKLHNIDINNLTYVQQCELIKDYAYYVIEECVELVREFESKRHKIIKKTSFDKEKVLYEIVDIFKFFTNLLIISGFNIKEFKGAWIEKTRIVVERFEKERK